MDWANAIYRRLIALYPGRFRERYAAEMATVFAESWERARPRPAVEKAWIFACLLMDGVLTLAREWMAATGWGTLAGVFAMVVLGGWEFAGGQFATLLSWAAIAALFPLTQIFLEAQRNRSASTLVFNALAIAVSTSAWVCLARTWPGNRICDSRFRTVAECMALVALIIPVAVDIIATVNSARNAPSPFQRTPAPRNAVLVATLGVLCAVAPIVAAISTDQDEVSTLVTPTLLLAIRFRGTWRATELTGASAN